jgi:hypothetical protein
MRADLLLLLSVTTGVSSCAKNDELHCPQTWDGRSDLKVDLSRSTMVKFPRVSTRLISDIDRCYTEHPYLSNQYYLSFTEERKLEDSSRILLFDIAGVSDIEFGVIVRDNDKIDDMGLVSLSSQLR